MGIACSVNLSNTNLAEIFKVRKDQFSNLFFIFSIVGYQLAIVEK